MIPEVFKKGKICDNEVDELKMKCAKISFLLGCATSIIDSLIEHASPETKEKYNEFMADIEKVFYEDRT